MERRVHPLFRLSTPAEFSFRGAALVSARVETSFCQLRDGNQEKKEEEEEKKEEVNPCKHRGPWVTRHEPPWNLRGGVVRLRLIRPDYLRPTGPPLPRSIIIPSKCVASSRGQPLITRGGFVDRFNWSRPNVAICRGRGSLKTVAEIWLWAGGGIFIPWTIFRGVNFFGKARFQVFLPFFDLVVKSIRSWFSIRNFANCINIPWIVCKFFGDLLISFQEL